MVHFLKALLKDIIDQAWTLLGMVVAWLVLEGSARDTVGMLIWVTLAIWVITFPLRYEKEEADDKEEKPKKSIRKAKFNPDARDGDNDGIVQDGTIWERKVSRKKK